jgi:hypothetical protein
MTAAVFLAVMAASAGAQTAGDVEIFLRSGEVVEKRVIREGITLPDQVRLELGGVRRRAAFKARDIFFPDTMRIGSETQKGLHDSWKFEVAAYELDKLLGLGMVPVTVARRIEGHEGALIDWVEGVLPEFGASPSGFDPQVWEDEVARVWLFDYLAYNIDRTPDNLLIVEGFKARLIDHSRAFQRFLIPMRPLRRFPRPVIENLRTLGEEVFREKLGPYLDDEELQALLERRKLVLQRVDELLASRPPSEVLF